MRAAGFDFGTSNSAIGVVKGNNAVLAPVEGGAQLIPSAVFFDFAEQDKALYGRHAVDAVHRLCLRWIDLLDILLWNVALFTVRRAPAERTPSQLSK